MSDYEKKVDKCCSELKKVLMKPDEQTRAILFKHGLNVRFRFTEKGVFTNAEFLTDEKPTPMVYEIG